MSEDTSAGRLILNNCTSVFLSSKEPVPPGEKRKIYEAVIEDKGKNISRQFECGPTAGELFTTITTYGRVPVPTKFVPTPQ